ncbi:class I SAM-dependent methyltransferase [Pedobacter sp. SYP-B3415]|uniref:class I SAM-dependent methyltransferase n=1 Tax=Pedobacter sp. SYP-B3415 TaxID=2496641 RepID=UPI00101D6CFA|nr:class I SAM-dependent methyltransferase [Pedobacter sp. SYP-B3415]
MLSTDVKKAYDDFYSNNDEAWRMLGARHKAGNIVDVCKGIRPEKVLEVGAGDGSILHYLDTWNFAPQLYALEIADSGVEKILRRKLNRLKDARAFDGYTIPYPDNHFDLCILAHVLEHVEHERPLLRELKRVSKHLCIEVPRDYRFDVDKKVKHFLDYGHINVYTPSSLRFLLKTEGFEIIADKTSVAAPEIISFARFQILKQPNTLLSRLKISLEYRLKLLTGKLLGRKKQEAFANAYTVLTTKSAQNLKIF